MIHKNVSVILALLVLFTGLITLTHNKFNQSVPSPSTFETKEKVKFTAEDIYCLAKNIYHEAGIESDLGKLAVAQVTLNRVIDQRWPHTICEVVHDKHQFSWTQKTKLRNKKPYGPNWERSKEIAYEFLMNNMRLIHLEDAYFYHAYYVKPEWSRKKQVIARIDSHIFYAKTR